MYFLLLFIFAYYCTISCDDNVFSLGDEKLFDFNVQALDESELSLSVFKDAAAILIINVALNCDYAYSKFKELNAFYERNKGIGVELIAFPCGQFGHELDHPEPAAAIQERYNITFPIMKQVDVNGPNASPVYNFLKRKTSRISIAWNFNKFLVINGVPVRRFSQAIPIKEIEEIVIKYIFAEKGKKLDL